MPSTAGWNPFCTPPRGLVSPVPVDPTGRSGPTRAQSRGPRWRQTGYGRFVPAGVDGSVPEQRVLEQAVALGPAGAVTGWAALRLAGASFFDGLERDGRTPLPVPLVSGVAQARRQRDGVRWLQDRLEPQDRQVRCGLPCTSVERALFDEMRLAPDVESAVLAMDMAAAAELTSLHRVRGYVEARAGWRGVPKARRALDLASEDSRSPGESLLRLRWELDGGLPRPLANTELFDVHGRLLGVADVVDVAAGVVGEYDGGVHSGSGQRSKDAARDSRFRDSGLEVFRVTYPDLHDRDRLVARIKSAYARAARTPVVEQPGWSVVPPRGWPRRLSLEEVLVARDLEREAADLIQFEMAAQRRPGQPSGTDPR